MFLLLHSEIAYKKSACFLSFFGVTLESHFISELRWNSVIIPMVLQIRETMVLQRVEREGEVRSSHIWIFGS